eukprot:c1443_g1_i2.p1 GENE.c1443_g1_i2~~c1443_g1_i2.p1  ORF type:complete len:337 (+),score=91.66 c1443_g1_i2:353-1363(+)
MFLNFETKKKGEWLNGVREGAGVLECVSNGHTWNGIWVNGIRSGPFQVVSGRDVRTVIFENNVEIVTDGTAQMKMIIDRAKNKAKEAHMLETRILEMCRKIEVECNARMKGNETLCNRNPPITFLSMMLEEPPIPSGSSDITKIVLAPNPPIPSWCIPLIDNQAELLSEQEILEPPNFIRVAQFSELMEHLRGILEVLQQHFSRKGLDEVVTSISHVISKHIPELVALIQQRQQQPQHSAHFAIDSCLQQIDATMLSLFNHIQNFVEREALAFDMDAVTHHIHVIRVLEMGLEVSHCVPQRTRKSLEIALQKRKEQLRVLETSRARLPAKQLSENN